MLALFYVYFIIYTRLNIYIYSLYLFFTINIYHFILYLHIQWEIIYRFNIKGMFFQDTIVLVADRRFNTSMKQNDSHKDYVLDVLPFHNIYSLYSIYIVCICPKYTFNM